MLRRSVWVGVLALFAASLFAVTPVIAQGVTSTIGVEGGVNFADVSANRSDIEFEPGSRTGFIGGVFLNLGFGDIFSVQPEVLYSQIGTKSTDFEDPSITDGEVTVKLDVVQADILLKINIPLENSPIRPHVFAGPFVSVQSSCKVDASDGGTTIFDGVDCELEEIDGGPELFVKSTDFGVVFGGGVDIDVGGAVLTVGGRYNLGLTNVNDDDPPFDFDIKTRVFSVMVGIGIPL